MTDRIPTLSTGGVGPLFTGIAAAVHSVVRRITNPVWLARVAPLGLCLSSVGFAVSLGATLAADPTLALVTDPLSMRIALFLPPIVAVCAVGTLIGAVWTWAAGFGSLVGRIHLTALAVLGIGFVWQLSLLGLLPP